MKIEKTKKVTHRVPLAFNATLVAQVFATMPTNAHCDYCGNDGVSFATGYCSKCGRGK